METIIFLGFTAAEIGVALLVVTLVFLALYKAFANNPNLERELEREDAEIVKQAKIWLDGFNEIIQAKKKDEAEGTIDEAVKTTLARLAVNHKIEKTNKNGKS